MLGSTEIIIIVSVILVLFGATAIPKFARSLGRAKKEFEHGIKDFKEEDQKKPEDEKKEKSES